MSKVLASGDVFLKTTDQGVNYISIGDTVIGSTPYWGVAKALINILRGYETGEATEDDDAEFAIIDVDLTEAL